MTAGSYTDAATGIKLKTWAAAEGAPYTFGMALPADALTKDATEYIGLLVRQNQHHLRGNPSLTNVPSAAPSPTPPPPVTAASPTASPAK